MVTLKLRTISFNNAAGADQVCYGKNQNVSLVKKKLKAMMSCTSKCAIQSEKVSRKLLLIYGTKVDLFVKNAS